MDRDTEPRAKDMNKGSLEPKSLSARVGVLPSSDILSHSPPQVAQKLIPPRLLNQVAAFNYVTAPNAPTYRAIMQAFYEAKQHYMIELRPGEILEQVRSNGYHTELKSDEDLERHLATLVEWGNLLRSHDTAAVSHIDDFYRKRYLFHLTAVGEAAHRAVLDVEATVGKSGSLQTTMLVKIRDALNALAKSATTTSLDPDKLVRLLHDLHSAFETLTHEANRFIGDLNRHFGGERMEEDRFVLHKQAVLAYISRFVEQLRYLAAEIAAGIQAVERGGVDRVIAVAANSADLPPALDDADPITWWIGEQHAKWKGVCAWFVANHASSPATVERLAEVAVGAVVGLTRTLGRLNDRRTRPVDRAADFRTLARWFAECRTDSSAHELWQTAFGLYSARHFHLEEKDAELTNPGVSWWETEPVAVPVQLRVRGKISKAGRPSAAADYSQAKQWIAQCRRRERAQLEAAVHRFAGKGPLRFSDIAKLDMAEFDLLLALLDEALNATRSADGTRKTRTADGRLTITLHPSRGADAVLVTLVTPRGRLRCHNYRITVVENALSAEASPGETPTADVG